MKTAIASCFDRFLLDTIVKVTRKYIAIKLCQRFIKTCQVAGSPVHNKIATVFSYK